MFWGNGSQTRITVIAQCVLLLFARPFPVCGFDGDDEVFKAPGLFSVAVPKGYEWVVKGKPYPDKSIVYGCFAKGEGKAGLIVRIRNITADNDEKRKDEIDEYFRYVNKMLRAHGDQWTVVERQRPEKMADRVRCAIVVKNAEGGKAYYKALIMFGKKTFTAQVTGFSLEPVDQMMKNVETSFEVLAK